MTTFIHYGRGDDILNVYGLPGLEYPGLFKLALHFGEDTTANTRWWAVGGWHWLRTGDGTVVWLRTRTLGMTSLHFLSPCWRKPILMSFLCRVRGPAQSAV